jgi:hypothetical protein
LPRQATSKGNVVRIVPSNELASGLEAATDQRLSQPPILLANDPHPGIGKSQLVEHLGGPVGRPIVDHDQLEVDPLLLQDTAQRAAQSVGPVMDGCHHGDGRAAHCRSHRVVLPLVITL